MGKKLSEKLKGWQNENLLSDSQVAAILAYEESQPRFNFMSGLIGVGVFSIVIGLIALISANWQAIPVWLKLTGHFVLNIAVAWSLLRFSNQKPGLLSDGLVLLFSGLILSFIALVGQVFQLEGSLSGLLMLWVLLATPVVLIFGRSRIVALPWVLAVLISTTLFITQDWMSHWPPYWCSLGGFTLLLFQPLWMILLAESQRFQTWIDESFAKCLSQTGFVLVALVASTMTLAFYGGDYWGKTLIHQGAEVDLSSFESIGSFILISILCLIGVVFYSRRRQGSLHLRKNIKGQELTYYWLAGILVTILPIILPYSERLLAMASFLGLWMFWGWCFQQRQAKGLVSLAIALLTLRLYIIFLELIGGSLLMTGTGLIVAGVIMLILVWLARKFNRTVARTLVAPKGEHP